VETTVQETCTPPNEPEEEIQENFHHPESNNNRNLRVVNNDNNNNNNNTNNNNNNNNNIHRMNWRSRYENVRDEYENRILVSPKRESRNYLNLRTVYPRSNH
jgi:hypothetical protein